MSWYDLVHQKYLVSYLAHKTQDPFHMPTVLRTVADYQAGYAALNNNTAQKVNCKKSDVYRCAVTVGSPTFFSLRAIREVGLIPTLLTSIVDKCSIVASNVERHGQVLRRHAIYDRHVSDIKRQISYSLGMAFGKFHSERLLGIHNLIHLEFLKKLNAVTFIQQITNSRPQEPDLVGQSSNGSWHVFEAKGTSVEGNVRGQVAAGKIQVVQIDTIHGQMPVTRTVSATYIGRQKIQTHLQDPSDSGASAVELDQDKFNRAYYAPFLIPERSAGLETRRVLIDGLEVRMLAIKGSSGTVSVGLIAEVYDALQMSDTSGLSSVLLKPSLTERESDDFSFGLDGFVVGFSATG